MKHSRWLSLLVLCTGFLLIVVDMTIVNVSLPSIGRDLHFTASGLAWVLNAYLVAFAGLLLLAGRLADLVGGKRIFLGGLGIFIAASLACGLAPSQPVLIGARFVQGVGGAASSAVILAMIVGLFPEPEEQARAFGVFGFVASAGAAIGLVAGGLITQIVSWHWIFFVNLPIGIATAVLAQRLLPAVPGIGLPQGADVIGAAQVTASLMLGVYAIVTASPLAGAIALALLVTFVYRQTRTSNPMLPLRLFGSPTLSGTNAVQALLSGAFLSFFFLASLDLERVLGYGPLALGLGFLPVAVVMGCFSIRFSAALVMRFGGFKVLLAGQLVIVMALVMVALGPARFEYLRDLLLPMALLGLGGGLSFPALTMIAMSDVPAGDTGIASGLLNTTGQTGGALGLAVLASVAAGAGFHAAWLVCIVIVLAAMGVSLASLRPGAAMTSTLLEEAA